MNISDITKHLPDAVASGNMEGELTQITSDSRRVKKGFVFVAIEGEKQDGHRYIENALKSGAVAIISQKAPPKHLAETTAWIHTADARKALATLAAELAGQPSSKLKIAGVTGTNGKTTTTFLLHHILETVQRRAGMLGTVWVNDGLETRTATHTTPEPVELQTFLKTTVEHECRSVVMEVSSHGLEQGRVEGVEFDVGVFTNLTQDHLDYHGSMESYYEAKKRLFSSLKAQGGKKKPVAVINSDDAWGKKLIKDLDGSLPLLTYGAGAHCDFRLGKITQTIRTCEFELFAKGKSYLVRMPIFGRYNMYNTVAAITAARAMGVRVRDAVQAVMQVPQVPGRLEWIASDEGVNVFVDYAHTPDALENVCSTLRELEPKRLITVFGCGGDRDRQKRPLMGRAASTNSDLCFVTSDNPRSEEPEAIIQEVVVGMRAASQQAIVDRREAITAAVHLATAGDIVLIAGKGHETYQEVKGEKLPFDDRKVARQAVKTRPLPARVVRQKEAEARKRSARQSYSERREDTGFLHEGSEEERSRESRPREKRDFRDGDQRRFPREENRERGERRERPSGRGEREARPSWRDKKEGGAREKNFRQRDDRERRERGERGQRREGSGRDDSRRGNSSRGSDSRRGDSRGNNSRGNDSRGSNFRGRDQRPGDRGRDGDRKRPQRFSRDSARNHTRDRERPRSEDKEEKKPKDS